MKKALLLLSGLILIGLLSYMGYKDKAPMIKNDLISKANNAYKERNITGITVNIKGKDLAMTRVLLLTGSVLTEEKREEVEDIANSIEGVKYTDNQTIIKKEVIIRKEIVIEEMSIEKEIIVKPKIIAEKKIVVEKIVVKKEITKKEITVKKEAKKETRIETTMPVVVAPIIAIPKTVEVPIPVKAVTAPVAIQLKEKIEEIPSNTKGVE